MSAGKHAVQLSFMSALQSGAPGYTYAQKVGHSGEKYAYKCIYGIYEYSNVTRGRSLYQ